MSFALFAFGCFAVMTLASAISVVMARNPVHSVLFLILTFFSSAGLFILLGAEFLAMLLVVVYVGAVAVLFLFVVMMLDIDFATLKRGFTDYLPFGLVLALVVLAELVIAGRASMQAKPDLGAASVELPKTLRNNTEMIGDVLYTEFFVQFQLAGIILFIAMIGAVVLTLRERSFVKKQSVARQMARQRDEAVSGVDVRPGEGI